MSFKCFVGHVFSKDQIDDLRAAIQAGFDAAGATAGIEFWYADDHISSGHVLDKIFGAIRGADCCIFEVSNSARPNVFLELGYAYACDKRPLLLVKAQQILPSDLAGYDHVQYGSMKELEEKIQKLAPQFLTPPLLDAVRSARYIPMNRKVVREAAKLRAGDVYDLGKICREAYGCSRLSEEESRRLQMMIHIDWLERDGGLLRLTRKGEKLLHGGAEVDKMFLAKGKTEVEAPDIAIPTA